MELLDGAKHFIELLTMEPWTLVIVDDMQATHAHLVQNVFAKDPSHRTISLNATYISLLKNPWETSQYSHLEKQVHPGGNGLLTAAYHDATNATAHSYLEIDFNQAAPEIFRLRNTLFPKWGRFRGTRLWTHLPALNGKADLYRGDIRTAPAWLVASFDATHSPWQQGTVQQESAHSTPSVAAGGGAHSSSSSSGVTVTARLWWSIVKHQIPSIKVLYKTNAKVTSILVLNWYHQRARHNW